jgi:hypothetical protein
MITKYKISGELERDKKKLEHYCPSCRNGKIFENDPHFKIHSMGSDTDEPICDVCITKYKFPRKEVEFLLDGKVTHYIDLDNEDKLVLTEFKEDVDWLKPETHIARKLEVDTLDIEHLGKIFDYKKTGVCNHEWKRTKPFKTFEGSHTLKVCQVCKMAIGNLHGKPINGRLIRVVDLIAKSGFQAEQYHKQRQKRLRQLDDMFDKVTPAKIVLPELPELEV